MYYQKLILLYFLFLSNATWCFAQKTPTTKTYHREDLVKNVMQNRDFQAYYTEMHSLMTLYQNAVTALNKQELDKLNNCHEEGGYYYTKPVLLNKSNDSLSNEELLAFAEKLREDADRKVDSLREVLSQIPPETLEKKKMELKEIMKKDIQDKYKKDEIFMRNHLKISPKTVNTHLQKATQHIIKLFEAFAQLQSTYYEYEDFSYVIDKSVKLYAEEKEKRNKEVCLQHQQKTINFILPSFIGSVHFNYLYARERMDVLEKSYYGMIHLQLLSHIEEYRKCMDKKGRK